MSEPVIPNPTPALTPVATPVAATAPVSTAMRQYLNQWDEKKIRMKKSWARSAIWLACICVIGLGASVAIGELGRFFSLGHTFLYDITSKYNVPTLVPLIIELLVPAIIMILILQACPGVLVWWERKVAAHMQGRLGPMDVGGFHGWAQTLADGIKLFLKEIIEPDGIDKWVYRAAPVVVFVPAYMSFAPLTFGQGLTGYDFDIGLIYVMAISGLSTIGILMAGWGSANKFSILGGLRAAAQVVSFEIPRVLSVVPIVMWAGTLSLTQIVAAQSGYIGGFFPKWFIFYPVIGQVAFVVYLITTIAETNRVPFDIPEAESELVAGFHTEYGGMKFAIFFMSEYGYVLVGSVLGTILFLGGGAPLFPALQFIPSWVWFLGKTLAFVFLFLWSRWTLPRLRVDRTMDLCWKIFLPWTLINILLAGAVILWRIS